METTEDGVCGMPGAPQDPHQAATQPISNAEPLAEAPGALEAQDAAGAEPDLDSTTFMPAEKVVALTFEQKVDHASHLMLSNNLNRPAMYRTLTLVADGSKRLFDLEEAIMAAPEYVTATQPPYFLIEWLVDAEALRFIEVDEHGDEVTPERREGLTEDEIDDLITDIIIEITDVGVQTLADFDPKERLHDLLELKPERYDTYIEVLDYLTEKRSYNQIDQLLRGRPVLMDGREEGDRPMQPSVFVDKLAGVGAIVYTDGWVITPEGQALLNSIKVSDGSAV